MLKILMPVDFSESSLNAFSYAVQMTQALHARLILLHVVEPVGGDATFFIDDSSIEEETTEAERKLYNLRDGVREIDASFIDVRVTTGFPVESILSTIKEEDISLVVMGTAGTHNKLQDMLGSNTYHVVKKAQTAVLAIPIDSSKFEIKKIALAVGLDKHENLHLLTIIKHIARHFKTHIELIHVSKDNTISLEDEHKSEAILWLTDHLKEFQRSFVTIPSGDVAGAINDYVTQHDIDLLCVSPAKHDVLEKIVKASITRELVLHSHIPLLTLPEDY